jgi:hypothetical protein
MSFKGFEDVNQRFKTALRNLDVSITRRAVEEILMTVQSEAAVMTPIDTSFLINSAYNKTWRTASGWQGEVGYGAEYAAAVHNMPGKLKGKQRGDFGMTGNQSDFGPMRPTAFGGGTGNGTYWSPDAEPGFLLKAVQNVTAYDLPNIIKSQYSI